MSDQDLARHRAALLEGDRAQSELFDKTLITLSGGALAVSLTFLHDIVGGVPAHGTRCALLAAWVLLVVSLFSTLFSFKASQRALRAEAKAIDMGTEPSGRAVAYGRALNAVALGALIVGVVFLMLFAYWNIGKGVTP